MKYVIANWKMNIAQETFSDYFSGIFGVTSEMTKIIISPPNLYLSSLINNYPDIHFSSQDISSALQESGAFTGEVSAKMFADLGIKYSIIGHNERRCHFNETDRIVKQKSQIAIDSGIVPIICIGENLQARTNGNWKEFLSNQIVESIPNSESEVIIAYEPIWAIGTGMAANTEEIIETISYIEEKISKVAKQAHIVYGGSVNGSNSSDISKISSLSGVLVGGASLKIDEFKKIIKAYA